MMVNLPLATTSEVDFGKDEALMACYREDGTARALALDNRGPLCFEGDGRLDPAILDAYSRYGFYVFENVLGEEEQRDLERDVADLLQRAPMTKGAGIDKIWPTGARRRL